MFKENIIEIDNLDIIGYSDQQELFFIDDTARKYNDFDNQYYLQPKEKSTVWYVTHLPSNNLMMPYTFNTEKYAKKFVERLLLLDKAFFGWKEKETRKIFISEQEGFQVIERIYNSLKIEEGADE